MNIWKQGSSLGVNNNESNKLYGKKAWRNFIKTHQYYFVEFNESIKPTMIPMGHFRVPEQSKYLKYQSNFKAFKLTASEAIVMRRREAF